MCDHLLSLTHILKLGHPIEEIRVRALSSVISKYNLKLVDESNLENTKILLEKLLDWFNFDKHPEEEKVLSLILKILKYENADLILKEIGTADLCKKVSGLDKKLNIAYSSLVQDIKDLIGKTVKDNFYSEVNVGIENLDLNLNGCDDIALTATSSNQTEDSAVDLKLQEESTNKPSVFRVEYFPWQHLTTGDKHVLTSVYEGLRYIDNKSAILQTCHFYVEVVLRDFPAEIFIQRPLIIRTFLQLINNTGRSVRVFVTKCLIKTLQSLRESHQRALKSPLLHYKPEFYSTNVFPSDDDSQIQDCINSNTTFDEDFFENDFDAADHNISRYQLSLFQFCFEVLENVLPNLGKKSSEDEVNAFIELCYVAMDIIISNLKPGVLDQELKSQLFRIFGLLQESLKYHKGKNPVVFITILYIIVSFFNSLVGPNSLEYDEIIPRNTQIELSSCITNYALILMFPYLHSEILKLMQNLSSQKELESLQDYKDFLIVSESMKSSVKFLKSKKSKSKLEKLECASQALASLDFHQNLDFIQHFLYNCLLKWRKFQLKEKELKLRERILLKLLAHSNDSIKCFMYKNISEQAVKLLGTTEAKKPTYEFPGDKMDFLFSKDVFIEIICHGLSSPLNEICKYSTEILTHLLKSKFIMSEVVWSDFLTSLTPCLSLLQCYADKSTPLGRCIVKMFDPDIAKTSGLPLLEVLKGNIRFLFSKNNLTRDEAISRLFWILSQEDKSNQKLPRLSVLTGLSLSGICSCVKPQEYMKNQHSFYSPGKLCDVLEMLTDENVEPNLRRSALSQIGVMMDDVHLHATFLEQKGLEKILEILESCLIEKEYINYPDSVIPIIDILKVLSFHNVSVRQSLSTRIDVLYNILRGLFLFSSHDSLRRNAVELLCLLLYCDCILRVPADVSIKCNISFPEIVANKMCLPFLTHVHWRNSRHFEPSMKKSVMSKENCAKLIRISWAIYWVGSLSDVLTLQEDNLSKACSPGLPSAMKITICDIEGLKQCAFSLSVKQTLYDIQNATTHEAVLLSLHNLHSYFLLYKVDKVVNGRRSKDIGSDISLTHMLWESTLERFMTSEPSCIQDETLLLEVIRFLQVLLKSFKSERLIDWVGKLLVGERQPLPKMLKKLGTDNVGLVGRELRLALIELAQEIVFCKTNLDPNKWFFFMELISEHLKLENKDEFYNVAYVDWFLSLLVDLTGKQSWNFANDLKYYENLIVRVVEIIIAFHCTKDSAVSFMGLNIVKNSLLVLNHILLAGIMHVKDWEKLWQEALTKVIGHRGDANYCWLLSLWFMRDSVTRAAAFQFFVGLTTTSQSCDLIIDRFAIPFEHIWAHGFKVLFDENECSLVRMNCALMLSNLTNHGTKFSCGNYLHHLDNINFYKEITKIVSNYQIQETLPQITLDLTGTTFAGQSITSPSLVSAVCHLVQSILSLNPCEVSNNVSNSGLLENLTKIVGEIPESAIVCDKHEDAKDILQMYTTICRLITRCITCSWSSHSFMLQSEYCVNAFFSMLNFNLFCHQSKVIKSLMTELWSEILRLFTALLMDNPECNNNGNIGFTLINRAMTNNGIDNFISSIYLSLTSDVVELRSYVFNFFINLFRNETLSSKTCSISDIFDRNISKETVEVAIKFGWKGFTVPEQLTLNFGVRAADILNQMFLLTINCVDECCRTVISDGLGSLLVVNELAQNYCVSKGLPDSIVTALKHICVKLNVETVDSLRKPSSKKKINPHLARTETLFQLLANLMWSNQKAKSAVADCALSAVVHKLWPWCVAKQSLLIVTLKMLCTFTHSSDQGCRNLVLSTSLSVLGLKKPPGSMTLLAAVMNQISSEIDLISSTHDGQVLSLCLQLLSNCCRVTECRSVISKGSFMQCFTKVHPSKKKKCIGDSIVEAWLKFFVVFSCHQEGQLTLSKNQDVLDLLILLSTSCKSSNRIHSLTVLRNLCFHQLNRVRMLSCCSFISLMLDTLESKKREEVQAAVVSLWALSSNSQKAKVVLRSSGFEPKLTATKRVAVLNEDMETADLIEILLGILKNK